MYCLDKAISVKSGPPSSQSSCAIQPRCDILGEITVMLDTLHVVKTAG